ncbi:MFS transporter [Salinigranum sp. GCM10025319]|uniref:MFS transporter n=1 Tax=Salinigranum sp. GCM10025319 TaxID=3252687 RepID=UPI003616DC30
MDDPARILLVVSYGWFLSLGTRLVFPALLPQIRATFDITFTTAGLLLSLLWFAYAVGQFPGGLLADRIGEGRVLYLSSIVSGLTIGVVFVSSTPLTLAVGIVAFGFSTALFSTTRFTVCSDLYPDRAGRAMGVTGAAGNVGNSVLPFVAGLVAVSSTWRYGVGYVVPLFVLAAVGVRAVVPTYTSESETPDEGLSAAFFRSLFSQVRNRSILLVTAIHLLTMFTWQGFTGFFPTYLIEVKTFTPSTATALFSLFFLLGVLVQPLSGACGDRFGPRWTLGVCFVFVSLSLAALPFVDGLPGLVVVTVGVSGLLGISPVTMMVLSRSLPDGMKGSGLGLLRSVYILLASSGPFVVGSFADAGLFDEAFVLLSGVGCLALVLCFLLGRD